MVMIHTLANHSVMIQDSPWAFLNSRTSRILATAWIAFAALAACYYLYTRCFTAESAPASPHKHDDTQKGIKKNEVIQKILRSPKPAPIQKKEPEAKPSVVILKETEEKTTGELENTKIDVSPAPASTEEVPEGPAEELKDDLSDVAPSVTILPTDEPTIAEVDDKALVPTVPLPTRIAPLDFNIDHIQEVVDVYLKAETDKDDTLKSACEDYFVRAITTPGVYEDVKKAKDNPRLIDLLLNGVITALKPLSEQQVEDLTRLMIERKLPFHLLSHVKDVYILDKPKFSKFLTACLENLPPSKELNQLLTEVSRDDPKFLLSLSHDQLITFLRSGKNTFNLCCNYVLHVLNSGEQDSTRQSEIANTTKFLLPFGGGNYNRFAQFLAKECPKEQLYFLAASLPLVADLPSEIAKGFLITLLNDTWASSERIHLAFKGFWTCWKRFNNPFTPGVPLLLLPEIKSEAHLDAIYRAIPQFAADRKEIIELLKYGHPYDVGKAKRGFKISLADDVIDRIVV